MKSVLTISRIQTASPTVQTMNLLIRVNTMMDNTAIKAALPLVITS